MIFQITNVRALQLFQVLRQGAAILISILMAKSTLSTTEIGGFEMLVFIGTTVSFFWIAGLNQGMLPFFPKRSKEDQATFITNIFLIFCSISVFVFLLLFFFENNITQWLAGQETLPHFQLYSVYLLFFLPSFLVDYFYLLINRPKRIVQFGVTVFSLQVLVVMLPIFLGWGLRWSIIGLVGLGMLRFIWLVILVFQLGKFNWNTAMMKSYFTISFPLILYALLSGFPAVFDNWLVGWYFNDEAKFAIFRFGARELPLTVALASALSSAMIPQIAVEQETALNTLKEKSLKLFHFLFPITIILMLTSRWWFPLLFSPDFAESVPVFNIFLLIIISRLIFPQIILIGFQKTRIIFWVSVLETLVNVILSMWLVQIFGLVGIALGTFLAYLFEKIVLALYLFTKHSIRFQQYIPVNWFIIYCLGLGIAFYFS